MHVLLSAAVSLDGYLDDDSPDRLLLSNEADFDRVDQLRAASDAIVIGAETLRRDNPRLRVRDAARRGARVAAGRPETPLRVVLSRSGRLNPDAALWHCDGDRVVYTTAAGAEAAAALPADVVAAGETGLDLADVLTDLADRGAERIMVEGGAQIHAAFLAGGLVDELRLAVAPVLIGSGVRFTGPPAHTRLHLADVTRLDEIVVLTYHTKPPVQNDP